MLNPRGFRRTSSTISVCAFEVKSDAFSQEHSEKGRNIKFLLVHIRLPDQFLNYIGVLVVYRTQLDFMTYGLLFYLPNH